MGLLKKSAVLLAGAVFSAQSMALGLGEISLDSALNQPLKAEIQLLDSYSFTSDELRPKLASAADFERAGINRSTFLNSIKLMVVNDQILVTTKQPVSEPFLNFLVELNWPTGRVLREYTLLLDPPTYAENVVKPLVTPTATPVQTVTPEPAPQFNPRPAPAPWESTSTPGTYRVMPGDTLWEIAVATMPEGVSDAKKMMLALQKMNPGSFIKNNINLIKAHTELVIPDAQTVNGISKASAVSEVVRQTNAWSAGVAQLDATESASSVASTDESTGGEVRLVSPTQGAAANGTSGSTDGNSASVSQDDLSVALEQLDESVRKNEELSQRIDMLAEQLEKAQRLLSLQNEQLAQLQGQEATLEEAKSTEAVLVEPETETAVEAVAESVADTETAEIETAAEETEVVEETTLDEQPAAPEEQVAEEKKSVAPAPVAPKQPTIVDQLLANVEMVLGALAALVLLIAFLLYSMMKRRKEDNEELEELSETEFDATELAFEDDESDIFGSDSNNELDFGSDDEADDVQAELPDSALESQEQSADELLTECDAYIAYGKFDQAIDLINNAIKDHPEHIVFRIKLLEVLASLDEAESFAYAERDLLTLNNDEANQKAAELRSQLSEPLALEDLPAETEETVAQDEQASEEELSETEASESDDLDFDFNLDDEKASEEDLELDAELMDAGLDLGDIEFDFGEAVETTEEVNLEEPATEAVEEATDAIEIDLDLLEGSETEASEQVEVELDVEPQAAEPSDNAIEFESEYEVDLSEESVELEMASDDEEIELDIEDVPVAAETPSSIEDDAIEFDLDEVADSPELEEIEDASALMEEMDSSLDEMLVDFPDSNSTPDTSADDEFDADVSELLEEPEVSAEAPEGDTVDIELETVELDQVELPEVEEASVEAEPETAEADMPAADEAADPILEGGLDLDELAGADDDFDFLEGTDEIATKLDLARAYIDMDDVEGARDLLKEVSQEGNDMQKQEAKNLLDKLS